MSGGSPPSPITISPGESIADAIAQTSSGGTITLNPGIYAEWVNVNKAVTLVANGIVIIQPPSGVQKAALEITASNVTLDGITIDATNRVRGIDVSNNASNIIFENGAIVNCEGAVSGEYGQGMVIAAGCSNVTVRNMSFDNIHGIAGEEFFCHAIYTGIDNLLVEDCLFTNVSGNCLNFYSHMGTYLMQRCYTYLCGSLAGIYHGTGMVINSVARECSRGVIANESIVDALFAHLTMIDCQYGVQSSSWGEIESIRFVNLVVFGSITNAIYCENTGALPEGAIVSFDNVALIGNEVQEIVLAGDAAQQVSLTNMTSLASRAHTDNGDEDWTLDVPITGVVLAEVTADYGGNARSNPPTIGAWE